MRKDWMKRSITVGLIFAIACLVLFAGGCAPTVPKQQYDALQSELDKAKADLQTVQNQLNGAKVAFTSLKPVAEVEQILAENGRDSNLWKLGQMTQSDYGAKTADEWGRISVRLEQIKNDELTQNMRNGWFAPFTDTTSRNQYWSKAYDLLASLTRDGVAKLSAALSP